jgi:hypothetical protein
MPDLTVAPSKVIVMPVSPALKPEPVTVIEAPGGPVVGLMVRPALTVKVTPVTESAEVVEPYAFIVWEPAVEAGTTKVALQAPRPSAEMPDLTMVPSKVIVIPVSLAPKPEAATVTEVPGGPLVRLRVMAPPSTVKVTLATEPVVGPYAPIA